MSVNRFRNGMIRISSFNTAALIRDSQLIKSLGESCGCTVRGPTPLPRKIKKFTVNRSSHVHKKSQETFEIRTMSRLLTVENSDPQAVRTFYDKLANSHLPDVGIRLTETVAEPLPSAIRDLLKQ